MNKKYISLLLAGLICFTSITPTFAYDLDSSGNSIENVEYQNTKDEDFTNQTNVFAELGSEYKVTIPKTIVLSGTTKKANYTVKVEGDIAGYETVNVVPDSSVELRTKNKDSQTGTITQDKTAWKFDNFDVDANGTVEASSLTAGKWSGTFNFNINLDNENKITVVELPVIGTALSDMSFAQIQKIAQENKTADYGIKVGDTIKVNDSIDAEIINIGNNYIEFCTTQKIIESEFYTSPQISEMTSAAQINYVNSDLKKNIEAWLNSQSNEFKSSLKEVKREYEVATLTLNSEDSYQTITNTIKDTEKIYIPTETEMENIYIISSYHTDEEFWTATPIEGYSGTFGYFWCSDGNGSCCDNSGWLKLDTVVMFQIG